MKTTFSRSFIRWIVAAVPALLWLGGCGGPTSVTDLRENPYQVVSFEVPADCGTVYLRIARRAQEQYRVISLATDQPGVSAKLAPDAQSATVTLVNAGGIGLRYVLVADLHALDPARTEVSLSCASRSALKEALLWQQWANTPLDTGKEQPKDQWEKGSESLGHSGRGAKTASRSLPAQHCHPGRRSGGGNLRISTDSELTTGNWQELLSSTDFTD